jgi:hypothetical protein
MMRRFLRWLIGLDDDRFDIVQSIECPHCGMPIWLPKGLRRSNGKPR